MFMLETFLAAALPSDFAIPVFETFILLGLRAFRILVIVHAVAAT